MDYIVIYNSTPGANDNVLLICLWLWPLDFPKTSPPLYLSVFPHASYMNYSVYTEETALNHEKFAFTSSVTSYPDPGSMHPDSGTLHPDSGIVHPNSGIVHPNSGTLHPDSGTLHPDSGTSYPEFVIVDPKNNET